MLITFFILDSMSVFIKFSNFKLKFHKHFPTHYKDKCDFLYLPATPNQGFHRNSSSVFNLEIYCQFFQFPIWKRFRKIRNSIPLPGFFQTEFWKIPENFSTAFRKPENFYAREHPQTSIYCCTVALDKIASYNSPSC